MSQNTLHNALLRCTPEEAGIPSLALVELIEKLKTLDSMHGIMVMRHGKVCLEGWWKPYRAELPHTLFSLSKSFTSSAVGLAQSEGLLALDDKLADYFPEYADCVRDEKMRRVTLRHLLTMSSGHASCARPAMLSDADGCWPRGFLSSTLDYEPGTHFAYNSAGTYMLAAVVRKVTGQNVREYLLPRLFQPLGIEPGYWECCPMGTNTGGWGLYLKTEDIARFAQMVLQKGVWNGRRILPEDYLAAANVKQIDNSMNAAPDWKTGYGYQFWVSRHGFRGDGASGQYAVMLPEQDMAIATTAGLANMQDVLDAFWDILLPTLKDEPLPADRAGHQALLALMDSLEIPLEKGDTTRRHGDASWKFAANPAGITAAAIHFGADYCELVFEGVPYAGTLKAGFGRRIGNQMFMLNDHMARMVAAHAIWTDAEKLEIHIVSTEASFRDVITVDFASKDKPLTTTCRFNTFRNPFLPELTAVGPVGL